MQIPPGVVSKEQRVTITYGALWALIGTLIGGVGASATWVASAKAEGQRLADTDRGHERSLADHEARIRALESKIYTELSIIANRLANIEAKVGGAR